MLNTERIRIMTRLNRYEEGPNKDYFRINDIFRSDYIGMALLKNFFCVTFGYLLVIVVYILYNLDYLIEKWYEIDLIGLGETFLKWYLILLVLYSLIVYMICSVRYIKMKKFMKKYDHELKNLEEHYAQNDRRDNG